MTCPPGKGCRCSEPPSQLVLAWGSAACCSSQTAVTSSTSQEPCSGERQRQHECPSVLVPPGCLPVFSVLRRMWHVGTFKAGDVLRFALLMLRKGGLQERRTPGPLRASPHVLPAARRSLGLRLRGRCSPFVTPTGPRHPGCVTSRAPDMSYSRLSSEVKRTGITGDKKALALCCPQL